MRAIAYVESMASFLTEGEYAVAMALARLARDQDDAATITVVGLGQLAARSERWTRRLLRALEGYGILLTEHQYHGVRWPRTTYRFIELEESRPKPSRDPATVISLARAMRRKAEAMRTRNAQLAAQQSSLYHPLLLATIYEEMQHAMRAEDPRRESVESHGA